jgi:hypothetical protein
MYNLLEEVLDTPCPEPAPYSALGTLVTVGHGDIPCANIPLHTHHHLLLLLLHQVQHAVLAGTRAYQGKTSLSARPG